MNGMGEVMAKSAMAGEMLAPRAMSLRERLRTERDRLQVRLDELNGLLAKLDAQPAVADLVDEVFKVVR